jgi:hypothetical protein
VEVPQPLLSDPDKQLPRSNWLVATGSAQPVQLPRLLSQFCAREDNEFITIFSVGVGATTGCTVTTVTIQSVVGGIVPVIVIVEVSDGAIVIVEVSDGAIVEVEVNVGLSVILLVGMQS